VVGHREIPPPQSDQDTKSSCLEPGKLVPRLPRDRRSPDDLFAGLIQTPLRNRDFGLAENRERLERPNMRCISQPHGLGGRGSSFLQPARLPEKLPEVVARLCLALAIMETTKESR
jgi:hypothetical protein